MTDFYIILGLGLFRSDEIQEGNLVPANQKSGNFPEMFFLSDGKANVCN